MTRNDQPDPFSYIGDQSQPVAPFDYDAQPSVDQPPWTQNPDDKYPDPLGMDPMKQTLASYPSNRHSMYDDWGFAETPSRKTPPPMPPIIEKALAAAFAIVIAGIGIGIAVLIVAGVWSLIT